MIPSNCVNCNQLVYECYPMNLNDWKTNMLCVSCYLLYTKDFTYTEHTYDRPKSATDSPNPRK